MNNHPFLSQNNVKYKNARASLLVIVVASFLNLFLYFANVYLLFSAYTPLLIVSMGDIIATETAMSAIRLVFAAFALVTIVPYLLCWIFSKKHVGWMIAALVLFGIDSLIFLPNFILLLLDGDFTMILDLVIRIWAIVSLVSGVIYGLRMKKEPQPVSASDGNPTINGDTLFENADAENTENNRQLTVSRAKTFYGCAMPITIYINQKPVGQLKNGQTQTFSVPGSQFELSAAMSNVCTGTVTVPYGDSSICYRISLKPHVTYTEIKLEPTGTLIEQ